MANPFDQFDAQTAPAAPQGALATGAQPAPSPATQSANPFDQFDQAAPQRDSLGGYLLPPAPPTAQPQPSGFLAQVDNVGRSLAQGATLGFGDELAAGADAATHALLGRGSDAGSFSERYDANLKNERARDASIPAAIAIPGQIAGGVGTVLVGAPAAVAKGVVGAARLIPGVNALADLGGAGVEVAGNALSRIPGAAAVAPAAGIAAEGAAYGGAQGFGDGDGGIQNRLASAGIGAATGAVLAPAVAGAGKLIGKGVQAVGKTLGEAGFGGKAPVLDAAGKPIIGSDGQPVAATPGVARVAGQQIADTTTDLPAARAALDNHVGVGWRYVDAYPAPDGQGMTTIAPEQFAAFKAGQPPPPLPAEPILPGDQPTTFQVTGDYGHGQKELELRNTKGTGNSPGPSEAFLRRAADQNAVRVNAIDQSVPTEASSVDLTNNLTGQQSALEAQRAGAVSKAGEGTLQDVGGAADSTPTQAGGDLRTSIDQARAPVIQQADAAVQQGQDRAAGAMDGLGGTLPAGTDAATAGQHFGQQFRSALDGNAQDSKAAVSRLYAAIDPDGTLAVNMQPARQAAQSILADLPQNAAPLSGEEAAIFGTMQHLPDAQSFRELGALNNRVTTAMRAARSDPAQAQTYARLSQLRGGLANIMQDTVESQAGRDAAAVQAGTMAPETAMGSKLQAEIDSFVARRRAEATGTGGDAGGFAASNPGGGQAGVFGSAGAEVPSGRRYGNPSGNSSLSGQPPLVANADQAAVDRIAAANAGYAQHKETFGARAPGVGPVLAPGPTAGTFKMADSAVPSSIFSKGAGAAERVQTAIRAGLSPQQIADYAAYDLRRAAQRADGTLDPAAFQKWRNANGEAFQALTRADPTIAGRFDTAQQASQRLVDLQTQRAALDATHPLNPGWGDAEVMQRVWQGGPKGADSVRAALAGANGSPVAAKSIADYAAYSLRKAAAPDGVLDPKKYATWAKSYDGALSAAPEIKARFDTAADAQRTLNATAEQHAEALKDFQSSVARHFLGGADPADRIGQILNSATRHKDMADLARLTANDPAARAGIQRAVVDHIFSRLQGNALAGQTGIEKLKSDQLQTFIHRAGPALHDVMTPQQVETLRKVALTLQRDNLSVDATRVQGGSDTTQKAGLMAGGATGSNLMAMVKAHGITGLLTVIGAKGGPVGAFVGNKVGAGLAALKAAGISKTDDLVKEAMLNPALARALLADLTPATERETAGRALAAIVRISAIRAAHTAVAVDRVVRPPTPPSSVPPIKLNSLAGLGAAMQTSPNALASARR